MRAVVYALLPSSLLSLPSIGSAQTGPSAVTVAALATNAAGSSTPTSTTKAADETAVAPAALEEIVVTAQRRSESLQTVPVAVTALTGDVLQAASATSVEDLARLTPGLQEANAAGFVLPRIRGVGTTSYGAGLENSVATYVDGVYIASGPGADLTLDDIERVEVLKGPQGTLFGRNATGGLINIVTRDPGQTTTGELSVGYGNYQTSTAHGYIGGAVTDSLVGDFAFRESAQGQGYGTNLATGSEVYRQVSDFTARSKWIWRPAELTSVRLIFDYTNRRDSDASAASTYPGTMSPFGPTPTGSPWDLDSNVNPYTRLRDGGVSLKIDQDIGELHVSSLTAYRRTSFFEQFDADATPTPAAAITFDEDERQFSQELQLLSGQESRLQWVAGAFFFTSKGAYDPQRLAIGPPVFSPPSEPFTATILRSDQTTKAIAGFAQATYDLTDNTHLTAGARYNSETKTAEASRFGALPSASIIPLGPQTEESKTSAEPTWRLSLDHQFDQDLMGYVSYNRGFKSGGFNSGSPTQGPFEPETLNAYEIGLKSELFSRQLRINAAGFYYDYTNIQVSKYINNTIAYYNAPAAKIYGIDLDMEARLAPGLDLTGGVSLLHDRFTNFPNALFATPLPTGGSTITYQSANGNELPLTPSATVNLGLRYQFETRHGTWTSNLGGYFNSGYSGAADNILRQSSFVLLDARLQWSSPGTRYKVTFFGKNLADRAIASSILASSSATLTHYEPPRTYGFELTAAF